MKEHVRSKKVCCKVNLDSMNLTYPLTSIIESEIHTSGVGKLVLRCNTFILTNAAAPIMRHIQRENNSLIKY